MQFYLIERVAGDVAGDVVGAEVLDEAYDAGGVAEGDLVGLPGHGLVEQEVVGARAGGQPLGLTEARHPHQDVAVLAGYEGRVDAEVTGYLGPGPAARERPPRPLQPLEREVPEVGLPQGHVYIINIVRRVAYLPIYIPGDFRGGGITLDSGGSDVYVRAFRRLSERGAGAMRDSLNISRCG